jgi:condensin-2 complex subunit D3
VVRAHAFTTLGKLCLVDEQLAKKSITVLVRELKDGREAVIRNNVLVIMCDLSRTFTSVVDQYVPSITSCIRDDNPVGLIAMRLLSFSLF